MPRQTVSSRRKTAEGWLDNRKLIGRFALQGHVSKLALLSEALRRHDDRKLVMEHFKGDSFRDFREFVRPRLPAPELPEVEVSSHDGWIMVDGEAVVGLSEDLPAEEREFVRKVLLKAYQARRGNLVPAVYAVYDQGEANALERYLKKIRSER